jgi:hypothetical protein
LKGPTWIAFTSKSFCEQTFLTSPRCVVFTTKEKSDLFAVNQELMPSGRKDQGQTLARQGAVAFVSEPGARTA